MTGSRSTARILLSENSQMGRHHSNTTPILLQYHSNTTPILLQYHSNTTPIPLHYDSTTTPLLLHYDSTTTPLRLHYDSTTTPLRLQYHSTTTPLLLHSHSSSFSHSSTSPFLSLPWCGIFFLGEKKGEECRYIYKKCYFCILIAHTAERGNF